MRAAVVRGIKAGGNYEQEFQRLAVKSLEQDILAIEKWQAKEARGR